jgi:hypothetical protein
MRLEVLKADGSIEEYFHTKVLGAISNALGCVSEADIAVAEQLAEVVTYFVYQRNGRDRIGSSEIFSMIKIVLESTGYEQSAVALAEHHHQRRMRRGRTEVASIDVAELGDAQVCELAGAELRSRWDKSRIVSDLVRKHGLDRQTARMIASMVEEKILGMGTALVPCSLVKQIVLNDTASVLKAQEQLAAV